LHVQIFLIFAYSTFTSQWFIALIFRYETVDFGNISDDNISELQSKYPVNVCATWLIFYFKSLIFTQIYFDFRRDAISCETNITKVHSHAMKHESLHETIFNFPVSS